MTEGTTKRWSKCPFRPLSLQTLSPLTSMHIPSHNRTRGLGFNMTPMIDVVFLLIIFFLVSSHLARQEAQLPLPLPEANSGQLPPEDTAPRVTLNVLADGRVMLAGRVVQEDDLQRRLTYEIGRSGEGLEVRVRSDRNVEYRYMEPILTACARAGIWNVKFAVYQSGESPT